MHVQLISKQRIRASPGVAREKLSVPLFSGGTKRGDDPCSHLETPPPRCFSADRPSQDLGRRPSFPADGSVNRRRGKWVSAVASLGKWVSAVVCRAYTGLTNFLQESAFAGRVPRFFFLPPLDQDDLEEKRWT